MPIALITETLQRYRPVADGRLLRGRMLYGFCLGMNARMRTFRIATSAGGKQFRMNLGHWPLVSVEEDCGRAKEVLAHCQRG